MRSVPSSFLLSHWKPASAAAVAQTRVDDSQTMILVTVSGELEGLLREISRDELGVDAELRRKITQQLSVDHNVAEEDGSGKQRALSPSTLAQVIPYIRRLRPSIAGGLLELLRDGGKLIFPDARAISHLTGEEKRRYDERREKLLMRQQHKEYARMAANIQPASREHLRDIQASFKFQAGMGANMLLAVFSAFIISFWAGKYVLGDKRDKTAYRMMAGLAGAIVMLIVELCVFVMRSLKADKALEAARKNAERSQSDLGVPVALSARRPVRNAGGRGVLEDQGGGRGRPGEYEMVPRGVSADDEDNEDEPLLPRVPPGASS